MKALLRYRNKATDKVVGLVRTGISLERNKSTQTDILYEEEADSHLQRIFPERRSKPKKPKTEPAPKDKDSNEEKKSQPTIPRVIPTMPEIPGETELNRELRRHNSTLPELKGQTITGEVKSVGLKELIVDLGWKHYQTFLKKEISLSQVYTKEEKKERKRHDEILPGDELHFRIEELQTPYGEMFVSTQKMRADIRRQLVWDELKQAFQDGRLVTGRTLNPCNAGFAIGIAGFVGFCPLRYISSTVQRKIGVLHPFMIARISDDIGRDLIVRDATFRDGGMPTRRY